MSIALSIGNNLTTNGVFTSSAVNNTSVNNVTDFASIPGGGGLILLSTQTASASATIDFTSGINSTYDSYVFRFVNIHPATDQVGLQFNLSTDGGSNYNVTKTTSFFYSYHNEADGTTGLTYAANRDLAQSTSFQNLNFPSLSNDNDSNVSGELIIYNPSSTTFVKHFLSTTNASVEQLGGTEPFTENFFVAGYGNTTSAINAVRFQMSSGNIDDGIIKMYGVV